MKIYFRGSYFIFRECDVRGKSEARVIALADARGEIQYGDPNGHVWLYVPTVGYGMRED